MTKLCACKEQTKAKLLNFRIPGLSVQHTSAEVENNPLLIIMFLNQHRGDGSVSHRQVHKERLVLLRSNQHWRLRQVSLDFVESLLLFCPSLKLILRFDLYQTHERLDMPRQIGDKSSDKVDFADELLQLLLRSRRPHRPYNFLTF